MGLFAYAVSRREFMLRKFLGIFILVPHALWRRMLALI